MLYVILLLVVVLIIAVVLKQRGAAKTEPKSSTRGSLKKGPAAKTKLVEEPVVKQQATTPLEPAVRSKIEDLIQAQNFSAAEAQINQALNRDNTQHELYLLLLDVHILQKDEFAISQLLTHLRSLALGDIVAQAERREANFRAALNQVEDTIDFHRDPEPVLESTPVTQTNFVPPASDTTAFDQLQSSTPSAPVEPIVEIEPLEFNFQPTSKVETAPVEEKVEIAAERTLDFSKISIEPTIPTPEPIAVEDLHHFEVPTKPEAEIVDISTDSAESTIVENKADAPAELDFSDFSFNTATIEEKPTEAVKDIETTEFDFSEFETSTPSPTDADDNSKVETTPTTSPEKTLDFSFKAIEETTAPSVEETPLAVENKIDFNFSATDLVVEKPAVTAPSFGAEPNLDFNLLGESTPAVAVAPAVSAVTESIDENDPIIKAFPALAEHSEAELNLSLAEQYIQLGAISAARELLDEKQAEFNTTQQTKAQELRNLLA